MARASRPSSCGIRMSISTTSGADRAMRSRPAWPSPASPTTSIVASSRRIIASAVRTSASSSTITTRTGVRAGSVMPATAATRGSRSPRRCSRARGDRPSGRPARSVRAVRDRQPGIAAVVAPSRSGFRISSTSRLPARPLSVMSTAVSGACLRAFVKPSWIIRYALRPIASGAAGRIGELVVQPDLGAGSHRLLDQGRKIGQSRLRSLCWVVGFERPEYAQDLVQVLQSAMGALPGDSGSSGDLAVGQLPGSTPARPRAVPPATGDGPAHRASPGRSGPAR